MKSSDKLEVYLKFPSVKCYNKLTTLQKWQMTVDTWPNRIKKNSFSRHSRSLTTKTHFFNFPSFFHLKSLTRSCVNGVSCKMIGGGKENDKTLLRADGRVQKKNPKHKNTFFFFFLQNSRSRNVIKSKSLNHFNFTHSHSSPIPCFSDPLNAKQISSKVWF